MRTVDEHDPKKKGSNRCVGLTIGQYLHVQTSETRRMQEMDEERGAAFLTESEE